MYFDGRISSNLATKPYLDESDRSNRKFTQQESRSITVKLRCQVKPRSEAINLSRTFKYYPHNITFQVQNLKPKKQVKLWISTNPWPWVPIPRTFLNLSFTSCHIKLGLLIVSACHMGRFTYYSRPNRPMGKSCAFAYSSNQGIRSSSNS